MLPHLEFLLNFQVYSYNHISSLVLVINIFKIYHPNITIDGDFCHHCLGLEKPRPRPYSLYLENNDFKTWNCDNKLIDVIKLVIKIVNKPQVKF
jgi:hypothetical protein